MYLTLDEDSDAAIKYLLDQVFHYHPGNEENSECWWRETAEADDQYGTRGYVVVWYNSLRLVTHHTYRYPPDWL